MIKKFLRISGVRTQIPLILEIAVFQKWGQSKNYYEEDIGSGLILDIERKFKVTEDYSLISPSHFFTYISEL